MNSKCIERSGRGLLRRVVVLWAVVLSLLLPQALPEAHAAAAIELESKVGFDGSTKAGRWYPVRFALNSPSEDLSGDLVVQIANPAGGRDLAYVQHVDLPKGSPKTVGMTLPGIQLNMNNNAVQFIKGGVGEQGEQVPFSLGKSYLETNQIQALRVGVIARDPDTMNFLSLLQSRNYNVSVIQMKTEDLPGESMMLDGLDVLVFNDAATDGLTPEQVKAVTNWVGRGGDLVLGGGAGYLKTAKAFESLSPVTYQGTTAVTELPALAQAAGKELALQGAFTLSTAEVKSGSSTLYQEGAIPLVASRPHEEGRVWYTGYDLALQPLASWSGSPLLWERALQPKLNMNLLQGSPRRNNLMDQYWQLQDSLNYFPSLSTPSFSLLTTLFLVYAAIVAPLLYFLLKRLDKREWAWAAIPLIAIISSAGIFMAGSTDKTSVLAHTLNTIELSGTGGGKRTSATAIFVPAGGTYELELPKSVHVMSFNTGNMGRGNSGQLDGTADHFLYMEPDHKRMQWQDVPYWSVRKAMLENEETEQLGSLESKLAVTAAGLKGEVTNRTNADLTDVVLVMNRQLYKLGSFKSGETLSVTGNLTPLPAPPYMDYGQMLYPYQGMGPDTYRRERQMLNNHMQWQMQGGGTVGQPLLIGWSKDQESLYKVNGETTASDQLNLWAQPVEISMVDGGQIRIPFGLLAPSITENTLQQFFMEPNGQMQIGPGNAVLEYKLPEVPGAAYANLKVRLNGGGVPGAVTFELWNEAKQQWEAVSLGQPADLPNAADYLSGGHTVRLKLTSTQHASLPYPEVALEGVVKP